MKKILTLLAAVAFASTTLVAEAATPRAAEDPSSPVDSNEAPMPKVRKVTPDKAKQTKAKKTSSKKHAKGDKGKKKHGSSPAKRKRS